MWDALGTSPDDEIAELRELYGIEFRVTGSRK